MKASINLGPYLREARTKARLSQADVARALDYSTPQFISNWERGVSSPPLNALSKLIELYNLQRDEVIYLIMEEERLYLENGIKSSRSLKKTA